MLSERKKHRGEQEKDDTRFGSVRRGPKNMAGCRNIVLSRLSRNSENRYRACLGYIAYYYSS